MTSNTTLKLEDGKTYVTRRSGREITVYETKGTSHSIFTAQTCSLPGYFYSDGRHSLYSSWDLVALKSEKTTLRDVLESSLDEKESHTMMDVVCFKPDDFSYYRLVVTKENKEPKLLNKRFHTIHSAQNEAHKICKSGHNITVQIVGGVISTYNSFLANLFLK